MELARHGDQIIGGNRIVLPSLLLLFFMTITIIKYLSLHRKKRVLFLCLLAYFLTILMGEFLKSYLAFSLGCFLGVSSLALNFSGSDEKSSDTTQLLLKSQSPPTLDLEEVSSSRPSVQPQQHAVQPPLHVGPPQAEMPQQDDIWAVFDQPLMRDSERKAELESKLISFSLGNENKISELKKEAIIALQCEIDERLERALRLDGGYDADFIFARREEIRYYSLYPRNKVPTEQTYYGYIAQLEHNPRQSVPFRNVKQAIDSYEIRR